MATFWPREGVIMEWPLNGQFHDAHDVILTSRTDAREMVDDDDEWPLVIYRQSPVKIPDITMLHWVQDRLQMFFYPQVDERVR